MMPLPTAHPALAVFDVLPLVERLFVRGRFATAPLLEVERRVQARARIADVGCGHGVLSAMLAFDRPGRTVLGIDPDPRKIAWAQASVAKALGNTRFEATAIDALAAAQPGTFDAVAVCDVLYLLPLEAWAAFFAAARALLAPQGLLLLKETFDDGGWRTAKCLAQEQLTVRVLRRTHSSGALALQTLPTLLHQLAHGGFAVPSVHDLRAGSTSPHVLLCARRA